MDGAWLVRFRWKHRGAWLWPAFVGLTLADAVVGHLLPPSGDAASIPGAALAGLLINLITVILLRRPLGALLRRHRPDLPPVVARDYAGTALVVAVFFAFLGAGLAHRSSLMAGQRALREATVRAAAWIGDRAPATFRRNVQLADTVVIQAGSIYRTCVPSDRGTRTYCVVVNISLPFASSVRFSGYEPNSALATGTG